MPWIAEAVAESSAAPARIWAHYTDVPSWTRWDASLAAARLDGPFATGTSGTIVPRGAPPAGFVITRAEPHRGFDDVTTLPHPRLPLARLAFEHDLAPTPTGGTRITHRIRISGLAGALAARLLGPSLREGLAPAVRALAALAAADSGRA